MTQIFMVGIGGFIGSILRHLLSTWVNKSHGFPMTSLGTLAVNLTGCFFIGLISGLVEERVPLSPEFRLLVLTGLLGGFTTFSTFSLESYHYLKASEILHFSLNIGMNVILGIALMGFGLYLSKQL